MEKNTKSVAQFLVECLEAEGVDTIFGIPGEENLALVQAIKQSPTIRFITTRHEQGAAFMADVYGRLTGKSGVCLSTLGPGATNLITAVADAQEDGAPLIALTGQVGTERMHLTSHQNIDLHAIFAAITKRSKQIIYPESVSEIVRIAFKYAESRKPGASHIDLPVNVASMRVPLDLQPLRHEFNALVQADQESIQLAADIINQAKSPLIFVGASAVRSNCSTAVEMLSDRGNIPVLNTMMAKGMLPFRNEHSLNTLGISHFDWQNVAMDQADVIICIGYDLVELAPKRWNPNNLKKIIHIDVSQSHIDAHYQPLIQVVGDITLALNDLTSLIQANPNQSYRMIRKALDDEFEIDQKDESFPIKPQRVLADVRKVLDDQDIVLSDVGAHKMWIARNYSCNQPNTCLISNGFATMGIALPGALAAKLLYPKRNILAICGDGGFLMNCQELETAVREKINIVVLIFNDDGYGLIRWKQQDRHEEPTFVDFSNPDFLKLAESFGCAGFRISSAQDIIPTLEKAFSLDVPVIIDCPIDYHENNVLTARLQQFQQHYLKSKESTHPL